MSMCTKGVPLSVPKLLEGVNVYIYDRLPKVQENEKGRSTMQKHLHEENRRSWNAATEAHNSHKGDQAAFFRNGGNKLYPEERALLGDIAGLSVVHLLCNAGQDTLSLAQMGARVTGVDISETAIVFARQLSQESGVPATFIGMDVYDWLAVAEKSSERFDIVFSSYGAMHWLSNLTTWAKGVAATLTPGGRFITVDYHPVAAMFDTHLHLTHSYFSEAKPVSIEQGIHDYVAVRGQGLPGQAYIEGIRNFQNPYKAYRFPWGIGEILSALLAAGLHLKLFKEYPYANGDKLFHNMKNDGETWFLPDTTPAIPLMYAIVCEKPA